MQTRIMHGLTLALVAGCFLASGGCGSFASRGLNASGTRKFEQARYAEAVGDFQKSLEHDPENADSYYNLACVYHHVARSQQRASDWNQAETFYNRCLDHDANHTDCYRGLAVLLHQQGRTDKAFRLLQGWADQNPISPEPRIELARLYKDTGHVDLAKVRLQEALALDASNAKALNALGYIQECEGNASQALASYQRSLYANRNQPQVAARVASLSSSNPNATLVSNPMVQPARETRMASRGTGTLR